MKNLATEDEIVERLADFLNDLKLAESVLANLMNQRLTQAELRTIARLESSLTELSKMFGLIPKTAETLH